MTTYFMTQKFLCYLFISRELRPVAVRLILKCRAEPAMDTIPCLQALGQP